MSDKTGIEWTDATWNPIVGCSVISPACTNCYAMAQAARIQRMKPETHYAGTTQDSKAGPVWTGKLNAAPDDIWMRPLRWKRPRRIFVNSMSDLFHQTVPDEWIDRVFAIMALAPQHTFQVLTKRPDRMRKYLGSSKAEQSEAAERIGWLIMSEFLADESKAVPAHWPMTASALIHGPTPNTPNVAFPRPNLWPLPNVWLGVTAEDQTRADERIPHLLSTPAAVRFVSVEPMLGPVHLGYIGWPNGSGLKRTGLSALTGIKYIDGEYKGRVPKLDWVICGGESGPKARPMHPDWARSLRDQCAAAGVPFFFKQWGEWAPGDMSAGFIGIHNTGCAIAMPNGGIELSGVHRPYDQAVNRSCGEIDLWRVGKRRAGSLLDGLEHKAFPEGHAHG